MLHEEQITLILTTDRANLFTQGDKSQAEHILPFQHWTSKHAISNTSKNVYCRHGFTRGFSCARFPPQKHLIKKSPLPLLMRRVTCKYSSTHLALYHTQSTCQLLPLKRSHISLLSINTKEANPKAEFFLKNKQQQTPHHRSSSF